MFRQIILMAALLLGSSILHSAQAQSFGKSARGEDFTGPYLGGTVGYGWGNFDADATIGGVTTSNDADIDGFQGGLLGGYGFQFEPGFAAPLWNGYMGLEGGYEWSNADGNSFATGIEKDETMLVTLRPGLTWGDMALGYGIVGYSRTQFEAGNQDEWLDGLVLGLGTEIGTFGPLKTRVEYVYTNYEDKDYNLGGANNLAFDGYENALKLAAVYRF